MLILALALAASVSDGALFEVMTNEQRTFIHSICEKSLDSFMAGDKTYLQRKFNEANIPMPMRLLITKVCITYSEGVLKGMKIRDAQTRVTVD